MKCSEIFKAFVCILVEVVVQWVKLMANSWNWWQWKKRWKRLCVCMRERRWNYGSFTTFETRCKLACLAWLKRERSLLIIVVLMVTEGGQW